MLTVLPESDVALIEDVIPEVIETVTVRRAARVAELSSPLAAAEANDWDAEQLLNYVAGKIQQFHGPFPRDLKKEVGIMRSFLGRWGAQAAPIAHYAFEVSHGMWRNAPIGITRFCQGCDPYFAEIIAQRF